jgi:hypothetical protein
MAVGFPTKVSYANGDVFSASDINDTNGTLNLLGSSVAYTAGKNRIINGDFRFNQRSFSSTTTSGTYGFDRWYMVGTATTTYSAQTFTAGTAPVAGYEAINYARLVTSGQSGAAAAAYLSQKIEDVRTYAGQTVTFSFWAKAASGTPKVGINLIQNFGSGGSAEVVAPTGSATLTTSWARYTLSIAVPSVSGKTIGTSSYLHSLLWTSAGTDYASYTNIGVQNVTIDFWGVQIEVGTATAFQTATGTIQGELAACQRYYARFTVNGAYANFPALNSAWSTTNTSGTIQLPTTMRVAPTSMDYSAVWMTDFLANYTLSSFVISTTTGGPNQAEIVAVTTGLTTYRQYRLQANNNANAYVGFSAEL